MQRKKAISLTAEQAQLKLVKELASVLSILHSLLVDYGPPWYTSDVDHRLRKALAEAEEL